MELRFKIWKLIIQLSRNISKRKTWKKKGNFAGQKDYYDNIPKRKNELHLSGLKRLGSGLEVT